MAATESLIIEHPSLNPDQRTWVIEERALSAQIPGVFLKTFWCFVKQLMENEKVTLTLPSL
jgi:hypothetical protein